MWYLCMWYLCMWYLCNSPECGICNLQYIRMNICCICVTRHGYLCDVGVTCQCMQCSPLLPLKMNCQYMYRQICSTLLALSIRDVCVTCQIHIWCMCVTRSRYVLIYVVLVCLVTNTHMVRDTTPIQGGDDA